jgi:galactokinase
MTAQELLSKIDAPGAAAVLEAPYGADGVAAARARLRGLVEESVRAFPETAADLRVFSAPGRTELGGNHTDHNRGKVLAASIQLDALAVVSPRSDTKVTFRSTGYPDVVVDIADKAPRKEELGTTEALVRGIAAEFAARGTPVKGFTATAASTVLSGSGLSSSAAVEVLFGAIFDGLYGGAERTALELAQIGQKAENLYFGKPCGLMDQTACASGGAVAIDFADPAKPVARSIPFDLSGHGFALCVVDTGGSHADLTPDYAAVPAEMKAVAALFGKEVLRDVPKAQLLDRAAEIRKAAGDRALLRAIHFCDENERVDAMLAALERLPSSDGSAALENYFRLVDESGNSSWELLQNVFSPKRPAEQGVSVALAMTREFLKGGKAGPQGGVRNGACRVHGGGFAGTIQAYVPLDRVASYVEFLAPVFGPKAVTVLRIRPVGATELAFG